MTTREGSGRDKEREGKRVLFPGETTHEAG